jgi:outer membrane lipoprotein-sorting protein
MSSENTNPDRDLEALLARIPAPAPSAAFQAELRRRVLDEFDQSAHLLPAETRWQRIFKKGVIVMSNPISRIVFGLAAVLVLAIWLVTPGPSIAFGDFLAPIVNAKTAKFKIAVKTDMQPKQPMSAFSGTGYFLAPNGYRQEMTLAPATKVVTIANFDRGRMMSLMPDTQEVIVFELKGKLQDEKLKASNPFGNLRAALDDYRKNKTGQLEELAASQIDGRQAFGFKLSANGMVQTMWGDAATGHLIRIESTFVGPPKTEVVMSDFEFDVDLKPSLFSLDPPEGYKTTTIPIDAAPPTEQDFIAALRRLTDATDGEFPTSLDTPGIAGAIIKLLKGKDNKEMMTEGVSIGRGLQFAVTQPPAADAHYAGKGVKRTGPKAPIFWYKPTGSEKYHVVFSDLSTGEADRAPDVPGAIRVNEDLAAPKSK